MSCVDGIVAAITSNCTTQPNGGLEVVAWAFNRANLTVTYDGSNGLKITDLANVSTNIGYKITGVKKLLNAGHDVVIADDRANKYKHYFEFQQFEKAAASILNVDNLNDIVIFVEEKDKASGGDGTFKGYGVKHGLFVATDTARANDANGARKITLESLAGQEEPFSHYVLIKTNYATTLALLNTLCTAS